ncbi:MAG: ferrous iron transport protein B [Limnochordales bacterium]|nr:ferrous iron transport protein B [Limnochordales bacterium]
MSCHGAGKTATVLDRTADVRSAPATDFVLVLAGNPNVGKSTIFNALTGGNQQVGNWPGKTVTRKSGIYRSRTGGFTCEIIDLPGTYSLDPLSPEEELAREVLTSGVADAVVVVVDATHLERTLYLALQLQELQQASVRPFALVVALTMLDMARAQKIHLDLARLAELLQLPVVAVDRENPESLARLMQSVYEEVRRLRRLAGTGCRPVPARQGVPQISTLSLDGEDPLEAAGRRYARIESILAAVQKKHNTASFSDWLDQYVLHPWLGYPILALVLAAFFWLTFAASTPLVDLVDQGIAELGDLLAALLTSLDAPPAVQEFLVEGIVGGVGAVLAFFPLMGIFFFLFAFLQDSGYLARAAFLLDRFMQYLGFHGRVFFVLLTGYGCNVPGVLAARILDNHDDRRAVILLEPLIPCAARLGVMTFLVAAFFPPLLATFVLIGLLVLDGLLVGLLAFLLRRKLTRGPLSPFLLELPDYRWPSLRTLLLGTWHELRHFLNKAGTIIPLATAGFWLVSHIPWGVPVEETVAGWIGRLLAGGLGWLGMDWRMGMALVSGALAKETALSTLAVSLASNGGVGAAGLGDAGLPLLLRSAYTPAQALSFLTVFMLYFPCLATARVMRDELGSRRLFVTGVIGSMVISLLLGAVVYAAGRIIF